jgi:hypothetical protein
VLLVQELAVVRDLADRRVGCGRDLDEVEAALPGQLDGLDGGHDAEGVALLVDDPDFARRDHLVDPVGLGFGGHRIETVSLENGGSSSRNSR